MRPFKITLISLLSTITITFAKGIEHIRVIWHENPSTEAYILWTTDKPRFKSKLYITTNPNLKNLASSELVRKAKVKPILYTTDFRHKVKLKGLTPNTNYYFAIKTGSEFSKRYYFRTAPDSNVKFKILFGGDSRSDLDKRAELNLMMKEMFTSDPSILALCHGGDYIANGFSWKQWKRWLKDHTLTTTDDGRILPIIPTRGNHEVLTSIFNDVFARPGGLFRRNYYRTKIQDFSLITLNTNLPFAGRQKRWLKRTLEKSAQDSKWIVTNYHRPVYPAVKKPGRNKKHWVPLFEKFQIDLAFESDGHTLKKTVPIYKEKVNLSKGIIYVGEGGLGVRQRIPKDRWYLQSPGYAESLHHVMTLEVGSNKMVYRVIDHNKQVFDKMLMTPRNRAPQLLTSK